MRPLQLCGFGILLCCVEFDANAIGFEEQLAGGVGQVCHRVVCSAGGSAATRFKREGMSIYMAVIDVDIAIG